MTSQVPANRPLIEHVVQEIAQIKQISRIALCIGNHAYYKDYAIPALQNAGNDASLMCKKLEETFSTIFLTNLSFNEFTLQLQAFYTKCSVEKPDIVLFYYAGHGCEYNGALCFCCAKIIYF